MQILATRWRFSSLFRHQRALIFFFFEKMQVLAARGRCFFFFFFKKMQVFAARWRFWRRNVENCQFLCFLKNFSNTEMRIFTKNAFFGHQMALFQEKLRNFGDFWMIFWQILKFLTKILHLLGKNLDFDWLSSKILTDICFEIKRDNFHAWSTWFVQCLPPDGVFLKILSEKRPILTLLLKKMFERHGFWRKKLQKWELGHWFTSDFLKI